MRVPRTDCSRFPVAPGARLAGGRPEPELVLSPDPLHRALPRALRARLHRPPRPRSQRCRRRGVRPRPPADHRRRRASTAPATPTASFGPSSATARCWCSTARSTCGTGASCCPAFAARHAGGFATGRREDRERAGAQLGAGRDPRAAARDGADLARGDPQRRAGGRARGAARAAARADPRDDAPLRVALHDPSLLPQGARRDHARTRGCGGCSTSSTSSSSPRYASGGRRATRRRRRRRALAARRRHRRAGGRARRARDPRRAPDADHGRVRDDEQRPRLGIRAAAAFTRRARTASRPSSPTGDETYLDAVVMETLRLRPVVPVVARKVGREVSLGPHWSPPAPC